MPPNNGQKKGPTLPPKPSTVSEEQWVLAHNASKLLELLATPDNGRGTSAQKAEHAKPLANKQIAALWLWQLVSTSSDARDEAIRAGAVETCAKLVAAHSTSATSSAKNRSSSISKSTPGGHEALQAYCLGILMHLAAPAAGSQSTAVREALLTVRPLILPSLLSLLAEASSTSLVAAAVGLLAVLTGCQDTHGRVKKIMASWDKHPLIEALTMQHSLPLDGGRHAAADAAAVLQAICNPNPPANSAAAAIADGSGTGNGQKDIKNIKEFGSSGKSSGSAGSASANLAEAAADATLTAAVQESVLAAGGLEGLLAVCGKVGSPLAARTAAAKALCHLMTAYGANHQVKDAFKSAGGLGIMLRLLPAQQLPWQARAAAARCIAHYLAPRPSATGHSSSGEPDAALPGTAGSTGNTFPAATGGVLGSPGPLSLGSPRVAKSKPLTALAVRNNLRLAAKSLRKKSASPEQQAQPSSISGGASSSGGAADAAGSLGKSVSGTAANNRLVVATAEATSNTTDGSQQPDPTAVASAAYMAAVAAWDEAIASGDLTTRAEHVIAAGCVPGLLLLCCGAEGAPPALKAAAEAAAAAATATAVARNINSKDATNSKTPSAVGTGDGGSTSAESMGVTTSTCCSRGAGSGARAGLSDLDAIAEPAHGETEDEVSVADGPPGSQVNHPSSRGSSAGGQQQGEKKSKLKKGKKKGSSLVPDMAEAQSAATAALKLLAMSGDAGRAALGTAGAQSVLVQLLTGQTDVVRWNARQVLVLLSISPTSAKPKAACSISSKQMPNKASVIETMGGAKLRTMSALADSVGEASSAGGGGAGSGNGGTGADVRPASQQRRTSIGSAASADMLGGRISSGMFGDVGLSAGGENAVGPSKLGKAARVGSGALLVGSSGVIPAAGSVIESA